MDKKITLSSGENCTLDPQHQVAYDDSHNGAMLYGLNTYDPNAKRQDGASIRVKKPGEVEFFNTENNHTQSGIVSNRALDVLLSYGPAQVLQSVMEGLNQPNTSASLNVAQQALQKLGISCQDAEGAPTVPVFNVADLKAIGKEPPQR